MKSFKSVIIESDFLSQNNIKVISKKPRKITLDIDGEKIEIEINKSSYFQTSGRQNVAGERGKRIKEKIYTTSLFKGERFSRRREIELAILYYSKTKDVKKSLNHREHELDTKFGKYTPFL